MRANVAQPEDIVVYGKITVAVIYSSVLNKREKEPELYDAIKEIAPEWWGEETQITLNKNLVCKRHRDSCNKEHSWIYGLAISQAGPYVSMTVTSWRGPGRAVYFVPLPGPLYYFTVIEVQGTTGEITKP